MSTEELCDHLLELLGDMPYEGMFNIKTRDLQLSAASMRAFALVHEDGTVFTVTISRGKIANA